MQFIFPFTDSIFKIWLELELIQLIFFFKLYKILTAGFLKKISAEIVLISPGVSHSLRYILPLIWEILILFSFPLIVVEAFSICNFRISFSGIEMFKLVEWFLWALNLSLKLVELGISFSLTKRWFFSSLDVKNVKSLYSPLVV